MSGLNLWRANGTLVPNGGNAAMLYFTGFVAQGMSGGPVWRTFAKNSPCGRRHCVIGMATELLRQPQQPTQVDELCRSIDQERKTAAQLVNQLRDAGCDGCR